MARLRLRATALVERVLGSLWFLPAITTAVAVVLAQLLSTVDVVDPSTGTLLFSAGPDGARTVLGTIAGSMITVTGLTFSLTVVALQVASGQFTPRLLRTFLADRGNQVVLSAFIATFAYALTLLRTIRSDGGAAADVVVPALGVTVAMALTGVSVGLLVYFVHHLTSQLRVDTVMDQVMRETLAACDATHPADASPTGGGLPNPPDGAIRLRARRSGYLQSLDLDAIFQLARQTGPGVHVRLRPRPGDFVTEGTTLAWAWVPEGEATVEVGPEVLDAEHLARDLHGAIQLGRERTMRQDVGFGIRQLVDIASKALSPGVNDPTTAVQATHRISQVLARLGGRQLHDLVRNDDTVAVGVPRDGFAGYLDLAQRQVRLYGAESPAVLVALAAQLRDLAEVVLPERLDDVGDALEALDDTITASPLMARDVQRCREAVDAARLVLADRLPDDEG